MVKDIQSLKEIINNPKKIVITTHKSPDGDAMGSSLGLYHFLSQLGHNVNVITPNTYPKFLHWMPGNENVIIFEKNKNQANQIAKEADLIFLLDFNSLNRISDFADSVNNSTATKILIDHHQEPEKNIAHHIFSETTASSTAQLIYEIIDALKMKNYINKIVAECLYVGIMTDTGSFKYPSTTAKTHHIVAQLIEYGAENPRIHSLIYDNISTNRVKLLAYCLSEKLLLFPENNTAIISLTEKELDRFNFEKGDTEGFVNYALEIDGIRFAIFIIEKDGMVKLSLRSTGNFKVNTIAKRYFSGGGHTNAAGGTSQISVNETIKKVKKIITEYKTQLNQTN